MSSSIVPLPFNQILAQKHRQLQNADRTALTTLCDPTSGAPTGVQMAKTIKSIQINAAAAGDNIIIPALAGIKRIYEVVMWNVTAQTLIWQQGTTGGNPIILTRFTNFPDLTGFTLGFNGNFQMPHWDIDNGQALILNLQNATQVDGFIRYGVVSSGSSGT